jgi:ATP-dependent DNA helicase PIF1
VELADITRASRQPRTLMRENTLRRIDPLVIGRMPATPPFVLAAPPAAPARAAAATLNFAPHIPLSAAQGAAVRAANGKDPVVFITGRAGTGKSTIISHLRMLPAVVVCAPTGIAALNCRGVTLHSLFKIPPKFLDPKHPELKSTQGLNRIGTLVIDEISMVRADVLDYVNMSLQYNRNNRAPFGGVKVIFVGDCRQLPPVVTEQEREAMRTRYPSPWWFDAHCLKELPLNVIQLTQIHRQQDPELIELLDTVRQGAIEATMLSRLNTQCFKGFVAPENALILTARRKDAHNVNQMKLDALEGVARVYEARTTGAFSEDSEMNVPSPPRLELKVGARVLVTKGHGTLVNGTLGVVTQLNDRSVTIRADGAIGEETLTEATWEKHRYTLKADQFLPEVIGTYKQIPLTHGWAITIHKAQGLTLESVCVDLGSGAFASGQAYVALSRTRSMESLSTRRPFNRKDFITDARVNDFHERYAVR